jgi:hypothetical protein
MEGALMAHFDLSLYETVAQRLERFWTAYPQGQIVTTMMHYDASTVIFRCETYDNNGRIIAHGWAEEVMGNSPVNKTSFLENCETSAIGRAISNGPLGHTGERASSTEMEKVNRVNSTPALTGGFATPKQIGFIKSLARGKNMDDLKLLDFMQHALQANDVIVETLTFEQASKVISAMKL